MLKLTVLIVVFFAFISPTIGYTCSCSCPYSSSYVGTAYSSSCSTSSCESACQYTYASCSLWIYTYASCTGSSSGTTTVSNSDIYSYGTVLNVGTIIAIVVGSLVGLGVLITTIVIIICLCKKKSPQVWAVQPQQQNMGQPSVINVPNQQWPQNAYHQPHAGMMQNTNQQYAATYNSTQLSKVQV